MKFHINVLLLTYNVYFSVSVRLNPLENNDKLQSINSEFIAEWQWESWPIKQNVSEKDILSPGPRVNAALWKDNNGQNWYLFGGQPIDPESEKIYSDIWKYSVVTRVWERVFPFTSSEDDKGKLAGKIGGMVSLRVNFFDETANKRPHKRESNIILCGRSSKRTVTKSKKNTWNSFSRRKSDSKVTLDESKSLAVYGPRTSKSNTVWQIDLKDKLWTGYVCCCDTSNNDKTNPSLKDLRPESSLNATISNQTVAVQTNQTSIKYKIDKTEDEIDIEQEHMTIDSVKIKKKKINQTKKKNDSHLTEDKKPKKSEGLMGKKSRVMEMEKERKEINNTKKINASETLKNFSTETVLTSKNHSDITTIFKNAAKNFLLGNKTVLYDKEFILDEGEYQENFTENEKIQSKLVSKYCPDFTDEQEPVSWCDGNNDALITVDLSSSQIILWMFNLKTSHWSQKIVESPEDNQWPGCSNSSSIRYAGAGEEVYILCSTHEYDNFPAENSTTNSTDITRIASEVDNSVKSVYRLNSRRLILENLGKIKLDRFYKEPAHEEMWKNESRTILQIIRITNNETVMLLAYGDNIDLWMLMKNDKDGYYFEKIENIWRGSALKWFTKYNAANYNFQFVSESNAAETTLLLNPRSIPLNEYWPRERGRFIIRILKNENWKNHSFGNQTREHNLTYDLLQSDFNSPITEGTFAHSYNLKVIVFFGISLAIFTIFGVIVFLKKCVNCPSRILMQNDCHKSPPIIRYSVMHDDLMYPVA